MRIETRIAPAFADPTKRSLNGNHLGPEIDMARLQAYVDSQPDRQLDMPTYVYDMDIVRSRIALLRRVLGSAFKISYAIKSNPNQALLDAIATQTDYLDASSFAETIRAASAGFPASKVSYSGPGKRRRELAAFIGTGAELVVESLEEIKDAAEIAAAKGVTQRVLVRINPDFVPRGFGASMSGKPSQFGIEEAAAPEAIELIDGFDALNLVGLHVYTGSNCLSAQTLIENFENMTRLFLLFSDNGNRPLEKLIFGAGFGLPYYAGQEPLDLIALQAPLLDMAKALRDTPGLRDAELVLELGRWIAGPAGALLTTVLSVKESRGQQIVVCDAGFNNHLAACGMMGSVFRKDWPIVPLAQGDGQPIASVRITGPLCTSIDSIAGPLDMPLPRRGDIFAIMLSGAYGLTASPTRFISHPDPDEILYADGCFKGCTESHHNRVLT